jgi:hypothetical protein
MFTFYNYGIVSMKVCSGFWSVHQQLRNCVNEGMLWFLECSSYFLIDDLILVVCGFNRTIRDVNILFYYL